MRKIVTGLFMSVDGVVEADDDWQFAYFDEEVLEIMTAAWAQSGAALIGRRSYEGYDTLRAGYPDSPMAAFLNSVPKYVVSTTLNDPTWPNTTVLNQDLPEQIDELKQQPGKDIMVPGSPTLVRWLLRNDLLDELHFSVLPIVVGAGVRLFEDMDTPTGPIGLELQAARTLANGVQELRYTPASK